MVKAPQISYQRWREHAECLAHSFACANGGVVTRDSTIREAFASASAYGASVLRSFDSVSAPPLPAKKCLYCGAGPDGHLRETLLTRMDPDTLVTEITVSARMDANIDFARIVECGQPDQWRVYGGDEGFEELKLHFLNPDGSLRHIEKPELDDYGNWKPGHVIEERIIWAWTMQISAHAHNFLGVNFKVDKAQQRISTDFWLHRCLETSFFGSTMPGGLDVDKGYITVSRDQSGDWLIEASKSLRFTERLAAGGQDSLALGRLLNFSAGGLVSNWMLRLLHVYASRLAEQRPAVPAAASLMMASQLDKRQAVSAAERRVSASLQGKKPPAASSRRSAGGPPKKKQALPVVHRGAMAGKSDKRSRV